VLLLLLISANCGLLVEVSKLLVSFLGFGSLALALVLLGVARRGAGDFSLLVA
jgi:hypothetical protein